MATRLSGYAFMKTAWLCVLALAGFGATRAPAASFQFTNVSDLPGGPGQGAAPSINNTGDIAFYAGTTVYFYDRSAGTFLNLMTLTGAPTEAWFPRLNEMGNIVMINPSTRDLWLFEAATQAFTNLATLPGYPGNTGANDINPVFDLNDRNQVSFHSGDLNFGDVYVYHRASGVFEKVTDMPGGPTRGRENRINNFGQVAYSGFPDIYLYDPSDSTTTNITDLPGGPGTGLGGFVLNDLGDIALFRSDEVIAFDAASSNFLYFTTLTGFPPGNASVTRNGLSGRGAISFWRDEIFYYDPADSSFTQLTSQGPVPFPGLESTLNDHDEIAFVAGSDVWLAAPSPATGVDGVPARFVLQQNVPNPFNPSTTIRYHLDAATDVSLAVYDLRGRLVKLLASGRREAGPALAEWDGTDNAGRQVASGVYFYRLVAGDFVRSRKMMLLK